MAEPRQGPSNGAIAATEALSAIGAAIREVEAASRMLLDARRRIVLIAATASLSRTDIADALGISRQRLGQILEGTGEN